MSNKKSNLFRGIRKGAHLSRKAASKAANFSGRVEIKADRVINGTDPTIRIYDTVLYEKMLSDSIPEITPIHPAMPLSGRKPFVTLLIPSLQSSSFFGGTATALILAAKIAKNKDFELRIVETLSHGGAQVAKLVKFFESNDIILHENDISLVDISPRRYNHYGYLDIHPKDVYIASAWWDAHLLNQLPLSTKFIYLIQDYEPIFYNNSDKYILAEQTYRSESFLPICNTKLMYTFMASKNYSYIEKNGIWFEPAVGLTPTRTDSELLNKKKKMFIYGRPSVSRNLFYFALTCVDELFSDSKLSSSDWEICMAGQDSLSDTVLPSGITIRNLGKMNMDDYYDVVRETDLAISPMMAPHPNYPTLEFASAGAAVVTTKYETKQDLSNYSKNIIITDIDKESFKTAILKAAEIELSERINNAKGSDINNNWHVALDSAVKKLVG